MERTHTCGALRISDNKSSVQLVGWAQRIRDHGGKKFIDLRDREGITQIVFDPELTQDFVKVEEFRREFLLSVKGTVRPRPEGTVNEKHATGEVEVLVASFSVLSECAVLPFDLDDEHFADVNEELRLEYRYLDLRRPQMQQVIMRRHRFIQTLRRYLDEKGFFEVETPNLTRSTPEGSRDFLVPYRKKKGEFFALPQSPQMFKQLLMVAGFEKYFQIASCYRDEDLRKDRQYEHKQLDMEISFASQEELFVLTEEMISKAFSSVYNIELQKPFLRLPYAQAMQRFGSDKPDLRIVGMELVDVSSLAAACGFSVFKSSVERHGAVKGICFKNGQDKLSRKDIDKIIELAQREWGAKGLAWMKVMDGNTIESSITKFFKEEELKELITSFSAEKGDLLFFAADSKKKSGGILDSLRRYLAETFDMYDRKVNGFCFITDFPLFDWNEEEDFLTFEHSPFTMPKDGDVEYLLSLGAKDVKKEKEKLLSLLSCSYDLVYNGVEMGSGAFRIFSPPLQRKIFELLGKSDADIDASFGWFMKAYRFGAPPHRGWGLGIDRLLMLAEGKASIRDVIPFPRNKHGFCPLTQSPAAVDEKQLKDLGLKLIAKK